MMPVLHHCTETKGKHYKGKWLESFGLETGGGLTRSSQKWAPKQHEK